MRADAYKAKLTLMIQSFITPTIAYGFLRSGFTHRSALYVHFFHRFMHESNPISDFYIFSEHSPFLVMDSSKSKSQDTFTDSANRGKPQREAKT